eukprot:5184845-Amphidinium_carterae.1
MTGIDSHTKRALEQHLRKQTLDRNVLAENRLPHGFPDMLDHAVFGNFRVDTNHLGGLFKHTIFAGCSRPD